MAGIRFNPHTRPPESIKNVYKFYQKIAKCEIDAATEILDFNDLDGKHDAVRMGKISGQSSISKEAIIAACSHLEGRAIVDSYSVTQDVTIYEASEIPGKPTEATNLRTMIDFFPGLAIIPSLIPKESQLNLISRLMHRDLADCRHRTNVHLHHQLPYHAIHASEVSSLGTKVQFPQISFFNMSPTSSDPFIPLDDSVHNPFAISLFLNRKLRWVTLGGQYDWTHKKYPLENPQFPTDLGAFACDLFPTMKAEAAIVNVYRPGDTLSIHRDVSEESNKGLVSISLGCDGLFIIGLGSEEDGNLKSLIIRLRSGDAVFMDGTARFAWHGVPRIIPDTCPLWLRSWPAKAKSGSEDYDVSDPYEPWRDWMSNKRINLNIRQMRGSDLEEDR